MNSAIFTTILRTLAAKAIPEIERQAIAWYLKNGGDLKGKADLALEYGMKQYAEFTKAIPMLNASQIDDAIVRQQLKTALAWAWERADEQVKQAAREVTQAVPAPTAAPVTDPYVAPKTMPPTGVPLGPEWFEKPGDKN